MNSSAAVQNLEMSTSTGLVSHRVGFFGGDICFDICGMTGITSKTPAFLAATKACLTRGAPTKPSPVLEDLLDFSWSNLDVESVYFKPSSSIPVWSNTIKGPSFGKNPALYFFEHLLPKHLGDWDFVLGLIVPEYPLFSALSAPEELIPQENRQQVDFYLPHASLVIEVDGIQHKKKASKAIDKQRNNFLKSRGIETLRISTQDLSEDSLEFEAFIAQLKKSFSASPRLRCYLEENIESKALCQNLSAVIRLQMVIIELIERKTLALSASNWNLTITQDFMNGENQKWAQAAVEELFSWFECFADIYGETFTRPTLNWVEFGLKVEINLMSRIDETAQEKPWVSVYTSSIQSLPWKNNIEVPKDSTSKPVCLENQELPTDITEAAFNRLLWMVFGHKAFRPGQLELIENILNGDTSLGLMPTGAGKSLTFQLPGLIRPGTSIVIVPIRALGRDHTAELNKFGFSQRAVNIDSATSTSQRELIYAQIKRGFYRFVFVSPERFQTEEFKTVLATSALGGNLNYFVVDEAHCLSEWGHDFRPSYLTLPNTLKELSPKTPVVCITATAAENTRKDLQAEFNIADESICFEMHRGRPELNFSVEKTNSAIHSLVEKIKDKIEASESTEKSLPGIVFSRYVNGETGAMNILTELTRNFPDLKLGLFTGSQPKQVDMRLLSKLLGDGGEVFCSFEDYKIEVQRQWKKNELDIVIATKAFGMGINKANVRFTVHAGMPASMESFYQEAGRAGRDGLSAVGEMLFQTEIDKVNPWFSEVSEKPEKSFIEKHLASIPGSKRGDLRAQLWFLNNSNSDLRDDLERLASIHRILPSQGGSVIINRNDHKEIPNGHVFQVALFRLYQLGVISSWNVKDWGFNSLDKNSEGVAVVEVFVAPHNPATAITHLTKRIASISGKGASLSRVTEKAKTIGEQADADGSWPVVYFELLTWVQKSQTRSRLESLRALYEECVSFTPERAPIFKERMENFFKIDVDSAALSQLKDYSLLDSLEILLQQLLRPDGTLRSGPHLRKLEAQVSRLREGTTESPAINFASGVLKLLALGPDEPSWEGILRNATKELDTEFWLNDGTEFLNIICACDEDTAAGMCRFLISGSESLDELTQLNQVFSSSVSRMRLFIELAKLLKEEV